jgi:hypothetical protein
MYVMGALFLKREENKPDDGGGGDTRISKISFPQSPVGRTLTKSSSYVR